MLSRTGVASTAAFLMPVAVAFTTACGGAGRSAASAEPSSTATSGDSSATSSASSLPSRSEFVERVGPPGQELSEDTLKYVADVIRDMQTDPEAAMRQGLHSPMLAWLTESPDVTVVLCMPQYADRDPNAEPTTAQSALTMYATFEMAAYLIEHPDADPASAEVQAAGLSAGLQAYEDHGGSPDTPILSEMHGAWQEGRLVEWHRESVKCGD